MNWLAHIFLSETNVESRLGNLLGDLVKGKDIEGLDRNLRKGMSRHYVIDKFTDNHTIFKSSKKRIDKDYSKFSGILVDIFYDHFLAKNWDFYSDISLPDFAIEIYTSFQNYTGYIPRSVRLTIEQMIYGDWLNSYQSLSGVENALRRIDDRIQIRMGSKIKLISAMPILEREYINFERDFQHFFPELQQHLNSSPE
jgi:acyl carrier protein phosphodiesterase